MDLYYLSAAKIPDKRAITIQQIRMCEAFANQGAITVLVHPQFAGKQQKREKKEWAEFYGVKPMFRLLTLPTLMGQSLYHRWVPKGIGAASMIVAISVYFLFKAAVGGLRQGTIIYSRNIYGVLPIIRILQLFNCRRKVKIGFEFHAVDEVLPGWLEAVIQKVDLLVTITNQLREDIAQKYSIDSSRICVEPDGADIKQVTGKITEKDIGAIHKCPGCKATIVYAGHLYEGRGVETLIECARLDRTIFFLIVGGFSSDLSRLKAMLTEQDSNVCFAGFVPPAFVRKYLSIADILVAPYTSNVRTINYASPLKIFEYMAAGKPIIISDHKVFREVLTDNETALFIPEQDPVAMGKAIARLLENPAYAKHLGDRAYAAVQRYSWDERAKRILGYFKTKEHSEPVS